MADRQTKANTPSCPGHHTDVSAATCVVHDTRGRTSWEVLVYPISDEACRAFQTVHLLPDTGEMQERLEGRGLLVVRSPLPRLGFSGAHPLKGKLRIGRPVGSASAAQVSENSDNHPSFQRSRLSLRGFRDGLCERGEAATSPPAATEPECPAGTPVPPPVPSPASPPGPGVPPLVSVSKEPQQLP